jgi:AraC family transcriptional regulator of arabinose operon
MMPARRPTLLTPGRQVLARRSKAQTESYRTVRPEGMVEWLLIHALGGCGRAASHQGEILVPPGSALLLPAGCPHDYGSAPGHGGWEIQWAHFLPRDGWVERLLAWPSPIGGPMLLAVSGETRDQVEQALALAISASSGPWPGDQELALSALEVALRLYDRANAGQGHAIDPRVRDAMDAIAVEPRLSADLARLARIAGLSVSRFAHLFRQHARMSPGRWAELVRLRRAASLLLGTIEPVAAIAEEVGFPDPLYFSARFRRHFGVSPRAYRERR